MTPTVSRVRLRTLFALFAVASLVLAGRLAYWQALRRGDLRDRNGAVLATTVELRSLYAIPRLVADRDATAAALAPILGEPADVLRAALSSGAEWLYLKRRLPEETANAV